MYYKIGIDVGGTNTDAVLVSSDNSILAKTKQTTTPDVSTGIKNAMSEVISKVDIPKKDIKYIMLGTTHCTNALIERKALDKIGAIRLGLPSGKAIPTLSDFPEDFKVLIGKHVYMAHGGYEFDGRPIHPLDEDEIKGYLHQMKGEVDSVAITGIFSKTLPDQELQVAAWAKEVLGDTIKTSCSHQLGGLGILERENAAILNAALQGVATKMVRAFQDTVKDLGLSLQLFIGQNDGTLMTLAQVQHFPVLTISSGPTNSIRGAGALSKVSEGIVIDVGGTTADGGVLVNSFPRESTQVAEIGGVRTNFRMPDVVTVGLGGGTLVRFNNGKCVLGPDSVGYRLKEKAIAFGGDTLTLSDFFLANDELYIDGALAKNDLQEKIATLCQKAFFEALGVVKNEIQVTLEKLVDKLKTDAKEIPVIACGGGSFLLPKTIQGASEVVFPEHLEVANAFGACIAQIGLEEETVINTLQTNEKETLENLVTILTNKLIENGAHEDSVEVLVKESMPLAYLPGAAKLKVKLCGDLIR